MSRDAGDMLRRLRRRVADTLGRTPVLIGHSHSKVIFEAAAATGFHLVGFNFWTAPQPAMDADRTAFHPEIARALSRGTVFSAIGGAAHAILALVEHPRPFDFVLPDRPDLPLAAGAEVLPLRAIEAAMAAEVDDFLRTIRLLRQAATGRVIHLEAPPPLEDNDRLLESVPWMFFGGRTRVVAPPAVRLKSWLLHNRLVAACCRETGVELMPVPPVAQTETGYLRPDLHEDAMHVNIGYGALVVEQMKRAL